VTRQEQHSKPKPTSFSGLPCSPDQQSSARLGRQSAQRTVSAINVRFGSKAVTRDIRMLRESILVMRMEKDCREVTLLRCGIPWRGDTHRPLARTPNTAPAG